MACVPVRVVNVQCRIVVLMGTGCIQAKVSSVSLSQSVVGSDACCELLQLGLGMVASFAL
jgi:hypothetical protein